MMEAHEIQNIVRAVLQAAAKPLSLEDLCQIFKEEKGIETAHVQEALEVLLKATDPVQELKPVAGGYRYQIRQKYAPWIQRKNTETAADPLPRALIETLAIIAYKQPISRGEVDLMRGKHSAWEVFQQLEERGWIKIVAYGGESKRAALYGTTVEFLEYFNLNSLHDLPDLEREIIVEKSEEI